MLWEFIRNKIIKSLLLDNNLKQDETIKLLSQNSSHENEKVLLYDDVI